MHEIDVLEQGERAAINDGADNLRAISSRVIEARVAANRQQWARWHERHGYERNGKPIRK